MEASRPVVGSSVNMRMQCLLWSHVSLECLVMEHEMRLEQNKDARDDPFAPFY